MRELEAEIPLRTLQYRLKSLIDRNRLVMVGKGRWTRYRICDDINVSVTYEEANEAPFLLSGAGILIHSPIRQAKVAKEPVRVSLDKRSDTLLDPRARSGLTLAQDLGALAAKLVRRQRDQARPGDLTISQLSVLRRLYRDGPATASSLARSEGMRQPSLGKVIASLEARDLVSSAADPTDGRQTLISRTDAAVRWGQEVLAVRQDWLTRCIQAQLSSQEQDQLAAAVELVRRIVDS